MWYQDTITLFVFPDGHIQMIFFHRYTLRDERLNFPGGSVAKNLPANAGDPGFTLLQEISRAGEPRNPCAAPAEPARPRAGLRKRGSLR